MTTLVVNPIGAGLTQWFTYNLDDRCNVAAFYPYLVMIGAPAGTFTFEIIKAVSDEVLLTKTFTSATIKLSLSTTDNYAHAFYPIIPDNPIQLEKYTYRIVITPSGYTESGSSYLGWAQQFEDIQNEMSYTPIGTEQNSLAFRIKSYKEGIQCQ